MPLRDLLGKLLVIAFVACAVPTGLVAQPAEAPPVRSVAEYIIGVEDVLDIVVWREEDITVQVIVRPDGKITVPLIGDVQAAGRTASEIAAELTESLSR
jgi:polysaccharide export outer membrane protein